MSLKLHTIITSTRPGRVGLHVAKWFNEYAVGHGGFDTTLVDIADFNLPIYDEPLHPRLQKYQHAHTKRWAESVNSADAFCFRDAGVQLRPVARFGKCTQLRLRRMELQASRLCQLWRRVWRPARGAGGEASGNDAQARHTAGGGSNPERDAIHRQGQNLQSNELIDASAKTMLDELLKWAAPLKQMRG
jgi:hypothetical protein